MKPEELEKAFSAELNKLFEQKLVDAPRKIARDTEVITTMVLNIVKDLVPLPEIDLEEIKEGISVEIEGDKVNVTMLVPLSVLIAVGK